MSHCNRILVIEDNADLADLVREVLEAEGFDVCIALTPDEGLARFVDLRPALVLLDLHLPGRSPLELIAQLRRKAASPTRIVAMTGGDESPSGVHAILRKPFDLNLLVEAATAAERAAASARQSELLTVDRL